MSVWGFMNVVYDKTADYLCYYTGYSIDDNNSSCDDEIEEYNNILNVSTYELETQSKRIHQDISIYDRYSIFFSQPTHVIDNIYLGSAYNAASYETLKSLNIKMIINATIEIRNYYPDEFSYHRYNLYDNNKHSIKKYLDDAYDKITNYQNTNDGNILIHCFMGASRSASLVIYYLMKNMKHPDTGAQFTFDDALNYLKTKRPLVNPTFRFTKDIANLTK